MLDPGDKKRAMFRNLPSDHEVAIKRSSWREGRCRTGSAAPNDRDTRVERGPWMLQRWSIHATSKELTPGKPSCGCLQAQGHRDAGLVASRERGSASLFPDS